VVLKQLDFTCLTEIYGIHAVNIKRGEVLGIDIHLCESLAHCPSQMQAVTPQESEEVSELQLQQPGTAIAPQ
jgi:hypothetical protein